VLASGLGMTSSVAFGQGSGGFSRQNLYAVNFGGQVIELAGARAAFAPAPAQSAGTPKAKKSCKRHKHRRDGKRSPRRGKCKAKKSRRR
jgi:hypothetical protein